MSDLINRQDAIDELDKGAWGVEWDKALAKTMIESLPSAERTDVSEILQYLDEELHPIVSPEHWYVYAELHDMISTLSAERNGKWIYDENGMDWNLGAWVCSECHCRNDNIPPAIKFNNEYKRVADPNKWSGSNYCPNCGARMVR